MEQEIDRGVSLQEAAKMIGVSRPTLYKLIENKQLKTVVFGFTKRIQKSEIKNYLEQFKTK